MIGRQEIFASSYLSECDVEHVLHAQQFGKSIRSLNIIDDFNREILDITIDTSLPSARVVSQLEQLIDWRGKPEK